MNAGLLKGIGFETEPDSFLAKEQFKGFLLKNPKSLALLHAIISCALLEDEDTVIICTPKELKCKYMQIFAEVVSEIFQFPILRYPNVVEFNPEEVIKRLLYYDKKIKKYFIINGSEVERSNMLDNMSKKDLKRELKKRGLYQPNMDKGDMVETLCAFY